MTGVGEHNDVPRSGLSGPFQEMTTKSLIEIEIETTTMWMRGAVRGRFAAIPASGEP